MNRDRFDWDKVRCEYHPKYGRETVVPYRKGVRVQHKRGKKLPPNTKYVGRPTRWGNPWKVCECNSLAFVLVAYTKWLKLQLKKDPKFLDDLRGYDLACWCPLDQDCHADILLEALK